MDYMKLQNGSDIRGVALEGIDGQSVNLTETVCKDIGRGFALWLMNKIGKKELRVAVGRDSRLSGEKLCGWICQAFPGVQKHRPALPPCREWNQHFGQTTAHEYRQQLQKHPKHESQTGCRIDRSRRGKQPSPGPGFQNTDNPQRYRRYIPHNTDHRGNALLTDNPPDRR